MDKKLVISAVLATLLSGGELLDRVYSGKEIAETAGAAVVFPACFAMETQAAEGVMRHTYNVPAQPQCEAVLAFDPKRSH